MFTRTDLKPLSIAAATAAAGGIALGVWAAPPGYFAEPVIRGDTRLILDDDPNLAKYKQVIAAQGGPGPLYVVPASYAPVPAAARPAPVRDDAALLDAQLAREAEAFEQRARQWAVERVAWLESRRQEWREAPPYPRAYAEPERDLRETETFDDEPVPPPVPVYSGPRYATRVQAAPAYPVEDPDERFAARDVRWVEPEPHGRRGWR